MEYKVIVDGKEIIYGANIKKSGFDEKVWDAICHEMVKVNDLFLYEQKKDDLEFIRVKGSQIDLIERYELLLELLPQEEFTKAGTNPQWVADEVDKNTRMIDIVKDDVEELLDRYPEDVDFSDFRDELKEYLGIE